MYCDYHVHTAFSADSSEEMVAYIEAAKSKQIDEICFTDHYDWDFPSGRDWQCDVPAVKAEIDRLRDCDPSIKLKFGVEMGVRTDEGIVEACLEELKKFEFDHVIASVHLVDGVDPYFPEYFDGKTRQQGFSRYLETIYNSIRKTDFYTVVGHIDYPAKGCPFEEKRLKYSDAPDIIDMLFKHVIQSGKAIELNTSILKKLNGKTQDPNIYKRYVELGGEYVTFGSDAHNASDLGYQFAEIKDFAKSVGIKYFASFDKKTPILHKI